MKGKRVVVSGGSGFIGSHLVQRLLHEGSMVAVVVRYSNIIKNERLKGCWDRINVIEADLRNRGALEAVRAFQPDIVFHLGAYNHVGESFRQVEECFDVNAKGTANLLDLCNEVQKFIYVSTSEVYGYQESLPFTESLCPQPMSPYAITKYAGELYCRMQQRKNQTPGIVVLRLFNAFGPYQSTKAVIPELILNCLRGAPIRTTKGLQTREFNYVGNLIDALCLAACCPHPVNEVMNICAGEEISINELVLKIADLTKTASDIEIGALPDRPNEIWRLRGESVKAREILNWSPRVSLEEGLKITIEWFASYLNECSSAASR